MTKFDIIKLAHMLDECEGGACGGDCGGACCGDCGAGGLATGDVLGNCDHAKNGYMGDGCFHVPFPAHPMLYRYGWTTKKGKTKYKNPYVKGLKTITAESDDQEAPASDYYMGSALEEFKTITKDQPTIYAKVLYYNRNLGLAWFVQKNGILVMYKPVEKDKGKWGIVKTYLDKRGQVMFLDKKGEFDSENDALYYTWKMAKEHQDRLDEMLKTINEQRFSPRDIMNWEAHGRDPRYFPGRRNSMNANAVQNELKAKFFNQFESVQLTEMGGTWKAVFYVKTLDRGETLQGQARVKQAIPLIDRIVSLMRMRDVQTNQYNISAVGV